MLDQLKRIKLNGVVQDLLVDPVSLRHAVGLPRHRIFDDGIYHGFQPVNPSNPQLQDIDHI